MTGAEPIIQARGLRKSYPSGDDRVYPLRGVDITLYPGQFMAIMGPSGSGKSTLMHILGCLDRPDEGRYLLNGQDTAGLDDQALSLIRASRIGFVFQAYNLIAQCTMMENIAMPFMYHNDPPDNIQERTTAALDRVGLSKRITHLPSQLSGGELQRAAIARALVIDPLIMLADEPTGNLDSDNTREILKIFRQINEKGTSLIVVTHEDEVARQADTVLHIHNGLINE